MTDPDGPAAPATRARRLLKPKRMHEELVEILATEICEGVYGTDDPLPSERDLMEEFGVSRLTVREAIAALQSRGMVTTRPGTRARVSAPQPDFLLSMLSQAATYHLAQPGGLRSLMQVRLIVETGTARIAAEQADDRTVAELKATLERNRAAMGDLEAFGRTDIEFHAAIARIVGNPMIDAFFAAVSEWLTEVRNTSLQTPGQTERAFKAHVRIFAAIEARDPMQASEEMSRHLTQLAGVYPPAPTAVPRHDEDRR
ncbi:FadR/GntR family transcriptional regulator [Jiella pacifica]|uniref:FCD domain-containing protein n=1 Tax=Jiella pacifica TaxID=2696469 RepID=A0A6N9T2L1_9HYPH|nr:FCD domain-containing protein [Jiella pacifica]NDW04435.1 FCD domain-containing protein [Jiella pacifica]